MSTPVSGTVGNLQGSKRSGPEGDAQAWFTLLLDSRRQGAQSLWTREGSDDSVWGSGSEKLLSSH